MPSTVTHGADMLTPETIQDRVANVPPPPVGCLSFVEATDTGAVLIVPPQGFRRGSRGLARFCTGLLASSVVLFGLAWMTLSLWGAIGGGLLFSLGFVGFLYSWDRATHRGVLDVLDDHLIITTQHLAARDQVRIPVAELVDVRLTGSVMHMDERPIFQLTVRQTDGRAHEVFSGRDNKELEWIVATLRHLLDMPDRPDPDRLAAYEAAVRVIRERAEFGGWA